MRGMSQEAAPRRVERTTLGNAEATSLEALAQGLPDLPGLLLGGRIVVDDLVGLPSSVGLVRRPDPRDRRTCGLVHALAEEGRTTTPSAEAVHNCLRGGIRRLGDLVRGPRLARACLAHHHFGVGQPLFVTWGNQGKGAPIR